MKVLFGYIKSFAPYLLALWVIIILVFSSISNLPNINTGKLEIRIDYILHFSEYCALAGLALLTFAKSSTTFWSQRVIILTLGLMIFASLDETHQLLIPARSFSIYDMISNFSGILIGILITLRLNRM